MVNKKQKIENIIIGINFNMFNEYAYADRVTGLKKILNNPLMYLYNQDVAESVFYTLKYYFCNTQKNSKPPITIEKFWNWNISTKATHWYGKYKFPNDLYSHLLEFDKFTKENNVRVIFIIVPHHKEFHNRLIEFGLREEENRFKYIMSNLDAEVYDFNYPNNITDNKENFVDPIHYNHEIGVLIVKEIFNNNFKVGKKLH